MSTILTRIGNTVEDLFGSNRGGQESSLSNPGGKQTCLEQYGMMARKEHLMRNEWRNDIEYTKQLVLSEYLIQSEFKVGPDGDDFSQMSDAVRKRDEDETARKVKENKEKRTREKKILEG